MLWSMTQQLAPPTNALALAGFILGLIAAVATGFVDYWTGTLVVLILTPALLAVIFGFVGINTANRLGGKRRKLAIWSVMLGFSPIWLTWVLAAVFGV